MRTDDAEEWSQKTESKCLQALLDNTFSHIYKKSVFNFGRIHRLDDKWTFLNHQCEAEKLHISVKPGGVTSRCGDPGLEGEDVNPESAAVNGDLFSSSSRRIQTKYQIHTGMA